MIKSACLGFNRSGTNNEMPLILKKYLDGLSSESEFLTSTAKIKKTNWEIQKKAGIDFIPSNDFSYCDQMLDAMCLFGNIHRKYYWEGGKVPLNIYFAMARGQQKDKFDVLPLENEYLIKKNVGYSIN